MTFGEMVEVIAISCVWLFVVLVTAIAAIVIRKFWFRLLLVSVAVAAMGLTVVINVNAFQQYGSGYYDESSYLEMVNYG